MSDNWQAGDDALCVSSKGWFDPYNGADSGGPEQGSVNRVMGVSVWTIWGREIIALRFSAWPNFYQADCFVKVTPGSDIAGQEVEREVFERNNPWKVQA